MRYDLAQHAYSEDVAITSLTRATLMDGKPFQDIQMRSYGSLYRAADLSTDLAFYDSLGERGDIAISNIIIFVTETPY